jgi:predicted NBD/HSP70 family sugar kinase
MKAQQQYVGLDVSLEWTSVCVVDETGAILWRGKCHSTPDSIHATLAKHAPDVLRGQPAEARVPPRCSKHRVLWVALDGLARPRQSTVQTGF